MSKLYCTCSMLCLAVVGITAAEAAGGDLVRMTRLGGTATIEIGPVSPHAFLPVFLLPDTVDDPSDFAAAVEAGAELAHVFRADADGLLASSFQMAALDTSLRAAVYSYVQGELDYLGTFVPNPMHESFQAPPRRPLGPVTIEVYPNQVIVLNGPGPDDDVVVPGGGYPLIVALKQAAPGSDPVIGLYGPIPGDGMQIGAGDSDFKAYVVHWGPVPMRFSVVGMTPDAKIGETCFRNKMNNGTIHGGVADTRFENLTIESRWSRCIGAPKGERFGILRFYDCHFATSEEGMASGSYYGFGYKWGIRVRALGRYDIRNCWFDPVLEHAIYIDSPQGDSYFLGIEHNGSTRTAIQIVDRAFDTSDPNQIAAFESGAIVPQPSGFGRLLIEDVTVRDLRNDGGSAITVAGFLGDVFIRRVTAVWDADLGDWIMYGIAHNNNDPKLVAFNPATGAQALISNLDNTLGSAYEGLATHPTDPDKLYIMTGWKLAELDIATGAVNEIADHSVWSERRRWSSWLATMVSPSPSPASTRTGPSRVPCSALVTART